MNESRTTNLAQCAYESIKERLAELDLMPGDRLSEQELAAQLQISRTPIRQALQRLHHEGLLDLVPRIGWAVPQLDFDRIDHLYDFRILIEQYAIQWICGQPETAAELVRLKTQWGSSKAHRPTDPKQLWQLDEHFHQSLVALTGNQAMIKAHQSITEHIRLIRRFDFTDPDRVNATFDEHLDILTLLLDANALRAQARLQEHIEFSKRQCREITLEALYQRRHQSA